MCHRDQQISGAFRNYAKCIRSFIYAKTGCHHTAEDITQDVYIRFYRAQGLDKIQDVKSYLFRVANNLVIDFYRAKNGKTAPKEIKDLFEQHDLATDEPNGEDVALMRERLTSVLEGVGELSGLCQTIFWLSRVEGFRNYEIAEMQNVCLSTVEKNISRATRHCRMHLAAA